MRRFVYAAFAAALIVDTAACSNYNMSPSNPSNSMTPPSDAVIVDVVGERGVLSFSPNPATVAAGKRISWHNADGIVHRVVFNDGEVDTGNIQPGAFSAPTGLVANGPYHCSIHPDMVGSTRDGQ